MKSSSAYRTTTAAWHTGAAVSRIRSCSLKPSTGVIGAGVNGMTDRLAIPGAHFRKGINATARRRTPL